METLESITPEILENNLNHTLFSWSAQSGLNPINVKSSKGDGNPRHGHGPRQRLERPLHHREFFALVSDTNLVARTHSI